MRIGFDAKRFYQNASGLGNYSRKLIADLHQFHPSWELKLFVPKLIENTSESIVYPTSNSKLWRTWGMGKSISEEKIEVFHGLSNELPFDIPQNIRKIVTIHDVIFKQFPDYYPFFDRKIYHLKTSFSLAKSDKVIATSEATASEIQKYYKVKEGKIEVVYQAVDSEYYHHKAHFLNDEKYFIYASSFTKRKNHLTLIQAFELSKKQHNWNLKLVGLDGEMTGFIQNQINQLGLQDRVEIILNVQQDQMFELMKNASAFVYPSLLEGFGIPLAEAAAVGLPMAVSRNAIFTELAGDSALYFHPNDERELASQLVLLTNDDTRIQQLQKRSILLNKIDSKRIMDQMTALYLG
jgi:glycosyltransferase involved in cell wall biosynthesis